MDYIKLVYWHTTVDNYGDLLSPYIISNLSGCQIIHKNYFVGNWKSHLYNLLREVSHLNFLLHCDYLFPFESNIVGIGSILFAGNTKSKIWGAGFMSENEECQYGNIYAVRGYKSLKIIENHIKNGCPIKIMEDLAIGDPALLLPQLIKPSEKKYRIGIVPHFSEMDYFNKSYGKSFHIIDIRSSDIEGITKDITSCEFILSTSLHGIVVAHAYGIPALWMEHSGLEKDTNGFKFLDYFSAVGIKEYKPIREIDRLMVNESSIIKTFEEMQDSAIPQSDLNLIRAALLKAAPFHCTK